MEKITQYFEVFKSELSDKNPKFWLMIKKVPSGGRNKPNKPLKRKRKERKLYNVVLCRTREMENKIKSLLVAVKTSSKRTTGKTTFREFGKHPARSTGLWGSAW